MGLNRPKKPMGWGQVGMAAERTGSVAVQQLGTPRISGPTGTDRRVTVFVCANCARPGVEPTARFRPAATPDFPWSTPVEEVIVPCAGRLQPEHLLRAFESGTDLLCVVACEEDNCHNLEGSCRAARRVQYVQGLLKEIGLGAERLMLLHLPGSAREDMAVGSGFGVQGSDKEQNTERRTLNPSDIAAQVADRLKSLPPDPMHKPKEPEHEISDVEEEEENED